MDHSAISECSWHLNFAASFHPYLRNGTKAPGKKILVALDLRAGAVLKWSESIKFGGSLEGPSENSAGELPMFFPLKKWDFTTNSAVVLFSRIVPKDFIIGGSTSDSCVTELLSQLWKLKNKDDNSEFQFLNSSAILAMSSTTALQSVWPF